MTELLPETWDSRELPVLREAVRLIEADDGFGSARLGDIALAAGLEEGDVIKSLRALESAGLIEARWAMPAQAARVVQISGRARQLVGQWPSEETALDRMLAALEAIASKTDDPEEKTRVRKFAAWLGAGATTVGTQVAAAVITGQIPH